MLSFKAESLYAWRKVLVTTGWQNVWATELLHRRQKVSCSTGNQIITALSYSLQTVHYTACNTLNAILLFKKY
jgi:hypothetical protein